MFTRVLVANRGEIAVRIMRACDELGLETVAVYSDADRTALHVRKARQAVRLGPPAPGTSYLDIARIIDAARATGADAIHPGYGFLAENPALASACADAGITFVGPTPEVMAVMGSKTAARAAMAAAGLPVVPGETPADQSDAAIVACARRIGFPVVVKASAGGGGKGMRVVRHEDEMPAALSGARHEAHAAFGDGTLYVERLIERPRHVEVQVLADHHGHAIHLFERDCSVQRRHQKVIEESPSPALTPALRARMGTAAAAAAQAVGYRNAGTMEFLLEGAGDNARFYFLEMNTRLQVEHPVTEAVTGLDLVRAQLEVAAGQPLPWSQDDVSTRGHAIECRVYAEDPAHDFLPQAGTIDLYREPGGPGVRVDSGVTGGSEISVHYDPMVAKVIAWADSRQAAAARARTALREFVVLGLQTNIGFLIDVLESSTFIEGRIHTAFLDSGEHRAVPRTLPAAALAAAVFHRDTPAAPAGPQEHSMQAADPWASLRDWRG
ncbi:MAG: acetyl-CoA carboxylase biotin carboxylase subunit [Vicinamibacterales bacterium]|nr:acetyl-CoA carboxylase biotin carboxylase subunit [Vicinamibacterales bacterium]